MTLRPIRVLIINKQLSFSVRIKQALEQIGGFEVSPFTTADTALEHLRDRSHDVALVDFTLPDTPGAEVVTKLREVQPDIEILASPDLPEVAAAAHVLDIKRIVDVPCSARELMPVLQQTVTQTTDALPETEESPAQTDDTETTRVETPADASPQFSSLDSVLIRMGGLDITPGSETLDVDMSDAGYADEESRRSQSVEFVLTGELNALKEEFESPEDHEMDEAADDGVNVFQQLAAEEPPMPSLEDSGTVGDLRQGVSETDLREVADYMMQERPPQGQHVPPRDEEEEDNTARIVLQNALDDSSPLDVSLSELLSSIERQFPENTRGVRPLPSWVRDVERYVREPDFLAESLIGFEEPPDLQTTQMADEAAIDTRPGELETEVIEPEAPYAADAPASEWEVDEQVESETIEPEEKLPQISEAEEVAQEIEEVPQAPETLPEETSTAEVEEAVRPEEEAAPPSPEPETIAASGEPVEISGQVTLGTRSEDPQVAQLALSLTQASLELTAEASLLAHNGEIVAYAGNLPLDDMEDLRNFLADDWEARPGEARIRFITLPSSGQDYMLYSRQTENEFTLSMIFLGNMPLRVIRRQSDRIMEALRGVPDIDSDEETLTKDLQELEYLEEQAAVEEETARQSTAELVREQQEAESLDDESREMQIVEVGTEAPQPTYTGELMTYTFLWVVRDPNQTLTRPAAQSIVDELDDYLSSMGWEVRTLDVYEDYIYLMADVPEDALPHEILPEIKRHSAEIAARADSSLVAEVLWADSYCVLTPGRELQQDEIQQFINFERLG